MELVSTVTCFRYRHNSYALPSTARLRKITCHLFAATQYVRYLHCCCEAQGMHEQKTVAKHQRHVAAPVDCLIRYNFYCCVMVRAVSFPLKWCIFICLSYSSVTLFMLLLCSRLVELLELWFLSLRHQIWYKQAVSVMPLIHKYNDTVTARFTMHRC